MSNFGVDYTAEDQSEVVQGGGGDFKSLIHTKEAEGPVLLRFIGYIETGLEAKQQGEGADDKVQLQFEVVSPRHVKNGTKDDGAEYSIRERLTVYLKKGTNSKSGFVNFFQAMDYGRGNTHFTQMLGEAFLADLFAKTSTTGVVDPKGRNVIHDGWNGKYTIRAPITTDAISNESVNIPVPEARYPQQCFVWNQPNKAMWDSIQIGDKAEDDETNFKEHHQEGPELRW